MKKTVLFALTCLISQALFPSAAASQKLPFTVTAHGQAQLDSKKRYIIGCDVTTTDISVGLFEVVDKKPKLELELKATIAEMLATFDNNFVEFVKTVLDYFEQNHGIVPDLGCFACPGNTSAQKDYIKHHHMFAVDGREIKNQTKLKNLFIINDFEVVGFGIQAVDQSDVVTLHAGRPRPMNTKLIVGAGNGLGTGLMLYNEKLANYAPYPISWSFVEFSPQSEIELQLNDYLQTQAGSRSWGKVLGAHGGILRLYEFLNLKKEYDTAPVKYSHYQEIFENSKKGDKRCKDAVTWYMKLYARLIRNVIYAQLPYNGVYITNSVAENNPELFQKEEFIRDVFTTDNDYLSTYMSEIPVYLVKTQGNKLRMYGAAMYALVYHPAQIRTISAKDHLAS